MFLVRWIRTLLSLPALWAGQAAAMLHSPSAITLLSAAWRISGSGEIARQAIWQVQRHHGAAAALARAAVWMESNARPEIAAAAGILAMEDRDVAQAAGWLEQGRRLGDDPAGMLETLEFLIALAGEDKNAAVETARRFEQRRDLPPIVSRMILSELLWYDMLVGRFEQAQARAKHLLAVEKNLHAAAVLWALDTLAGRTAQAETHLAEAGDGPPAHRLYCQGLALSAVGLVDRAREILGELRRQDENAAARLEAALAGKGGVA